MTIILIILAAIFVGVLCLHTYKQFKLRQQRRIDENEYHAAVTLWESRVRSNNSWTPHCTRATSVLDFTGISLRTRRAIRFRLS